MGPAGTGKSTYCIELYKNISIKKNSIKIFNLDPSSDNIEYPNSIDIRNLINVNDAMNEFDLGPNGALLFCMEYIVDNLNWLTTEIIDCLETYLIFDCPGQIELYIHSDLMKTIIHYIGYNTNLCINGLFFIDSQFIGDLSKFFACSLTLLGSILTFEIPYHSILSKTDLIKHIPKAILDKFLVPSSFFFEKELSQIKNIKHKKLTQAVINTLQDFSLIYFILLDMTHPKSLLNLFETINFYSDIN